MKIYPPIRDIAKEGPDFFTKVTTPRMYKVETIEEARILHAYAKEITRYLKSGSEGVYLHDVEEMPDLSVSNVAKLKYERQCVFANVNAFGLRTGLKVSKSMRNIRRKAA